MSGLTLASLAPERAATWAVESPTPGVVIIDVVLAVTRSPTPLHLRVGDWTKPPVDVEVSPDSGVVEAIQLVLQDERVATKVASSRQEIVSGLPRVVVADWPSDRYWDVRCPVAVSRAETGELIIDLGEGLPASHAGSPGSLLFGWDAAGELCQLVIGPLSPEDWDDVNAFAGNVGEE